MDPSLPPFHPDWLKHQESIGGWSVMAPIPAPESRLVFDAMFEASKPFIPPPSPAVSTQDVDIPNSPAKVRIYMPQSTEAKAEAPLPVGLWIHAGGWFCGSIEHEDWLCRYISEKARVVLFSVEYRLAPENPYPAGLDDCCAAYEYMHNHAGEYGGDASKKMTMGGSAAGNLSLCVVLRYADTELKAAGCAVAALAACDPRALPEEYKKRYTPELYRDSPMIGNEIVALARDWYGAQPDDPLASPLLHPHLRLIPKMHIATGTKDPTHQETLFLSEECKKQGVDVDYVEFVGWPHYFWVLPNLDKSYEFLDLLAGRLRWIAGK